MDDQNRTTVGYYCTILRVLVDAPPGYACFDYECRECAGGCSCPYQNDGECDEPEGTGYCAEGTDSADC